MTLSRQQPPSELRATSRCNPPKKAARLETTTYRRSDRFRRVGSPESRPEGFGQESGLTVAAHLRTFPSGATMQNGPLSTASSFHYFCLLVVYGTCAGYISPSRRE